MALRFDPQRGSYVYVTAEYPARLERAVDGDTVVLLVDQGLRGYREETFRIVGFDAEEERAADAEARARALLAEGELVALLSSRPGLWPLRVVVHRRKSFDRWLAELFFTDGGGAEKSVAAEMVARGHQKYPAGMTPEFR